MGDLHKRLTAEAGDEPGCQRERCRPLELEIQDLFEARVTEEATGSGDVKLHFCLEHGISTPPLGK